MGILRRAAIGSLIVGAVAVSRNKKQVRRIKTSLSKTVRAVLRNGAVKKALLKNSTGAKKVARRKATR